ncbi:MAG: 4Fe-4S dicluster domain-containing protein [Rikenellaceae bacterium]
MLRKVRVWAAAICFTLITLLFLDFTGTIHSYFGWLAKIQLLPALLAFNVGVVALLIIATLLFGRLYCSVICPLGVFQDIVSRFAASRSGKKARFSHSKNLAWLRFVTLALFVVALVAGVGSLVALLAPYSAYGRIASNLFAPVWQWGNNILAYVAERRESYLFYEHEVWIKSISTFIIAVVTFVVISILAWRNGRTYCNTICPVGTILGYLSQFSLLKPYFDMEKCNSCGLCERKCKASCISSKQGTIDYTRCVLCFDCIESCNKGAMRYGRRTKVVAAAKGEPQAKGESRKAFLATSLVVATAAAKAQTTKVDGGLALLIDKQAPERKVHIVPPGAQSIKNLASKCTGCQLCISVCPNGVLRPSMSLERMMQPELSFERGFCRPECTKCSEVCPTGAIELISREEKSMIHIGRARWSKKNCVVFTDDVDCGACAAHCPAGAITMVAIDREDPASRKIPIVNADRCIGCGACEYICPAAPFSAIHVEGNSRHITL